MKKWTILLLIFAIIPLISAFTVEQKAVNNVIIKELQGPAIFELKIMNSGATDEFKLYNLVGINTQPTGSVRINSGETKTIDVKIYPTERLMEQDKSYSFVLKVKGTKTDPIDEIITLRILDITQALGVSADNIHLNSTSMNIYLTNKENYNFENLEVSLNSEFFSQSELVSIEPYEKKQIIIPLNEEDLKGKTAGDYPITVTITINNQEKNIKTNFKFTEKADISKTEDASGFFIHTTTITKTNEGNLPVSVEIETTKNIISRLLTTYSLTPNKVERNGFRVYYYWNKQLEPGESLEVKTRTSWIIPIVIILILIGVLYIVTKYLSSKLIIKKTSHLVRTKGGEFALRITIRVKAKSFLERVTLIDKLPPLLKLHEKFMTRPDKIEEKNRRLLWNIPALNKGETRIFSYILYSKLGVVGKFEIPPTTAIYEVEEKVHEIRSNTAFFIGEQRHEEK